MEIAFTIFNYFPYGGLQLDFLRMLEEMVDRGHRVTVLCSTWEGPLCKGVQYKYFPSKKWTNWGKALDFEAKACDYLKKRKFDLVMGFNRMKGSDLYFAADNCFAVRARKKGFFARLFAPRYRVFEEMEKSVFSPESKTKIFYLTEQQKQDFIRCYGTQEERFIYLAPGVSHSFYVRDKADYENTRQRVRSEFHIPEGMRVLIQVCSSFHTKGLDRTIRAMAALPEMLRDKVILLAVGREKASKMKKLVKKLSLPEESVIFTGGRNDVADLLCGADLMVHPARNEATGGVLAEGMCNGLGVICSGCCGYSFLISEAGGKVLREPFIQAELEKVLRDVLGDNSCLKEIQEKALEYGREKAVVFHDRAKAAADEMERRGAKRDV